MTGDLYDLKLCAECTFIAVGVMFYFSTFKSSLELILKLGAECISLAL